MNFFYAATTITDGNVEKASFGMTPWLHGNKPKDIAPLIFSAYKTKKWSIKKAMDNDAWIGKININEAFSLNHATQYGVLWRQLSHVQLENGVEVDIV
jgi:hypothetical protein